MLNTLKPRQPLKATLSTQLSPDDAAVYDAFIAEAQSGHYSQSRAWAAVVSAAKPVTPLYFVAKRDGHMVGGGLVLRAHAGLLPLPLAQFERGPVCDSLADLPELLVLLKRVVHARGIARLSVMPYWAQDVGLATSYLRRAGFADCQSFAGRHARSLRVDLTAICEDDPFAAAGLAKVRQAIRRAERAGASARQGARADLATFRTLHEELLRASNKSLPGEAWYDAMADYFQADRGAVFVSEFQGKPVSVILVTCHGGLATYALGASSGEALRFPKMILPMAQAILWAKRMGAHTFDLGGIPLPGDPDRKRASIAEFKYGFSHTEISLVREHVRWF